MENSCFYKENSVSIVVFVIGVKSGGHVLCLMVFPVCILCFLLLVLYDALR